MFGSKQREAMTYKVANHNIGEVKKQTKKTTDYLGSIVCSQKGFDGV